MARFLKLENGIVINTEVHDSKPNDTEAYTYHEALNYIGIGWELTDAGWVNPNAAPFGPKRVDLDGNVTKWLDSIGEVETDTQTDPTP